MKDFGKNFYVVWKVREKPGHWNNIRRKGKEEVRMSEESEEQIEST